jgi:hypothetical protein
MTLHLKLCSPTSPVSKIFIEQIGLWGKPEFLLQCFFKNSSSGFNRGDKEAEVAMQRS